MSGGRAGYFPLGVEFGSALVTIVVLSVSQGSQNRNGDLTDHPLLLTEISPLLLNLSVFVWYLVIQI